MSSPFGFDTEPIVIKQPDILINNPSPIMEKKPAIIIEEPVQKTPPTNSEKFQTTETPRVNIETAKKTFDIQSNWGPIVATSTGVAVLAVVLVFYFIFGIIAAAIAINEAHLLPIWMKIIYGTFAFLLAPLFLIYRAIKEFSFKDINYTKYINILKKE